MHFLIMKASRFSIMEVPVSSGWSYRRDLGAWVDADSADSLMATANPSPNPNRPSTTPPKPKPVPMSKKFDHETGEDMKGR